MVYKATKNLNLSRNNKAIFSDKCSTYCFLIVNAEVLRQNCFPRPSARPTLRLSHVNSIPLSLGRSMVILFYKQKRLTNFALILHFYMEVVGTRFFPLSRYHYLARCHWCEAKLNWAYAIIFATTRQCHEVKKMSLGSGSNFFS